LDESCFICVDLSAAIIAFLGFAVAVAEIEIYSRTRAAHTVVGSWQCGQDYTFKAFSKWRCKPYYTYSGMLLW